MGTGSSDWEKGSTSPSTAHERWDLDDPLPQHAIHKRFLDSFKRNPYARATPKGAVGADGKVYDVENANIATAQSPLQRRLKGRHLQMIAIGGSIGESISSQDIVEENYLSLQGIWHILTITPGSGLFVGSGAALSDGGPASLLIAFCLIGVMLYCTVHALGEMAVLFPVAGSFSAYSTRFLDPAWGFAMGWK